MSTEDDDDSVLERLRRSDLTELVLEKYHALLGDTEWEELIEALSVNTSVQSFSVDEGFTIALSENLSESKIHDRLDSLLRCVGKLPGLEHFNFHYVDGWHLDVSPRSFFHLLYQAEKLKTLNMLFIRFVDANNDGLLLCDALRRHPSLEEVKIDTSFYVPEFDEDDVQRPPLPNIMDADPLVNALTMAPSMKRLAIISVCVSLLSSSYQYFDPILLKI